jgi:hypothetical protein
MQDNTDEILTGEPVKAERYYGKYLVSLIWPFGGMIAAFRYYRAGWAKNVFWLFCIFFGLTFIIAVDTPGTADSARYARWLSEMHLQNIPFRQFLGTLYSPETNYSDVAQPLITFVISRFTDNPRVLFVVFAIIFGYFYSRNIWFVLERTERGITFLAAIFIVTFLLLNPLWNIGGFRMWTAANVFVYGTFRYLVEGKWKGLIWVFVSVLFHFSFFMPVLVLLLFIISGKRLALGYIFFVVSYFITELPVSRTGEILNYLPVVFRIKLAGYSDPDYVKQIGDAMGQLNWYVIYADRLLKFAVLLLATAVFFLGRNSVRERKELGYIFGFGMFLFGFANMANLLPSGYRYIILANIFMFSYFTWVISFKPYVNILKPVFIISVPALFLADLLSFRIGLDSISLLSIIGNPIVALTTFDPTPLINYIK